MAEHGGNSDEAAKAYGMTPEQMYDLSTGISPIAYDMVLPSSSHYQKLPMTSALDDLYKAARGAYQVPTHAAICCGAGSQSLLGMLPNVMAGSEIVWCREPTYNEHRYRWEKAGHQVDGGDSCPDDAKIIILGQPNNPDGRLWKHDEIAHYHAMMAERNGLLIIDEAFVDAMPEHSYMPHAGDDNLVILRSVGKFYGLAGIRVGFAIGGKEIIAKLADDIGPWPISQPAIDIALTALSDHEWQISHSKRLYELSSKLVEILAGAGFTIVAQQPLFVTIQDESIYEFHDHLARHGFWTRIYQNYPSMMRLGLISQQTGLSRFASVVSRWQK